MAKYSTAAAEEEKVAVIHNSEGEEDDNNVENCDSSPLPQTLSLPSEVWAMVINCE